MELSNVKLIATDIDGTLLNSKHELSENFYPLFNQLKSKGILFTAASGRQYYNLLNLFSGIQQDLIFVAENGSYVVYKGMDILIQAMETDTTRQLLKEARMIKNAYSILCGRKMAYVENDNPEFIRNVKMYYAKYAIVDDLLKVDDDQFLKIAICDLAGSEQNSYLKFADQQDRLQVKVSGSIWLDLSHKLANKGRAIEVLQNKFGISYDQTMIFGDFLNDLEMMQKGYFSYAVANAHPEIKNAARFLTQSNDENGVLNVLQKLTLDERS
jgi:Cof subfamily protein (haloacid dehalogenase superfamily)